MDMFIHNGTEQEKKERYNIDCPYANYDNYRELILQKNRNGPTRSVLLFWQSEITRFENLDY